MIETNATGPTTIRRGTIGKRFVAAASIALGALSLCAVPQSVVAQETTPRASEPVRASTPLLLAFNPCSCWGSCTPRYEGPVPTVLYRADTRPPIPTGDYESGIFETGFTALGNGMDLVRHVVRLHDALPSGYIAATESADGAQRFGQALLSLNPEIPSLWIYTIRATEAFHNVEQSLLQRQDTVPIGTIEYSRLEVALQFASRQREWVTADPIAPSLIQSAHEVTRENPHFDPNGPHSDVNEQYQSDSTQASCQLI